MKIEDILSALPSKEDLAQYAGVQTRASATSEFLGAFSVFSAGLIVGAGLALLFAPKAGADLRQDLANRGQDLARQGQDLAGKVGDKVNEMGDRMAKNAPSHVGNA